MQAGATQCICSVNIRYIYLYLWLLVSIIKRAGQLHIFPLGFEILVRVCGAHVIFMA